MPSSHTSSSPPLESLVKRLLTLPPQPDHSYSPMSVEHLAVSPDVSPEVVAMDDPLFEAFVSLPQQDQVSLVSDLLSHIADKQHSVSVPKSSSAAKRNGTLNRKNKPNLIYDFCRGLGSLRPDGSDSLIPTSRMPFGLLQYLIEFFTTQGGLNVHDIGERSMKFTSSHKDCPLLLILYSILTTDILAILYYLPDSHSEPSFIHSASV